ncbi:uncharacterized protein TNCT_465211 [Trichonephila clavata]|uniref:Uncharacterized protein n=1 Tax=Trichonephila clavata TaxID=2740835 RepID=A0A8X6F9K0_TRICU|nr:uncharacterized protein TNCT_465211 [Trichonephila clavata]
MNTHRSHVKGTCTRTSPKNTRSTPKRNVSGKENNLSAVARIHPITTRRVGNIIDEVRVTACKTITNVKSSFNDMSQKLKQPLKRTQSFRKRQQYEGLKENITPVKLYTPFNFVTPSPPKSNCKRVSPRRCSFKSPTGRLRRDVQQLNRELKELKEIEQTLCATRLS